MVALTQDAALAILKELGVAEDANYLWARSSGSTASRVLFDITSNPAIYRDLFERQVLLVATPDALWVYPLVGRHKGQPERLPAAAITALVVYDRPTEKRLDLRVAGKARHFIFPADLHGGMRYNGVNAAHLTANHWYGMAD